MYLPNRSAKHKTVSYVQLFFHTNAKQQEVVSLLVNDFNKKISDDDRITKALPNVQKGLQFSNEIFGSVHNSKFNMHMSLSQTIYFGRQKLKGSEAFYKEVDKVVRFDQNAQTSNNPSFLRLQELRGGPIKVKFKPQLLLLPDFQRQKVFLSLLSSPETNSKLMLIVDYIDSLVRQGNDYGIHVQNYFKYDENLLHSTLAHCTPKGKFNFKELQYINEKILTDDIYKPTDEFLEEMQFDTNFFVVSKSLRSLKRIPIPR